MVFQDQIRLIPLKVRRTASPYGRANGRLTRRNRASADRPAPVTMRDDSPADSGGAQPKTGRR
jgi:hypothetical protein